MRTTSHGTGMFRVAIAVLLAMSLVVVALSAALPAMSGHVVAQDDDEGDDDDDDEDDDEDANRGNDDDGEDDDNRGKDKKDKKGEDDEGAIVTSVPTATPEPKVDAEPTGAVLTPVSSPTGAVTTPVGTGTLLIRLRVCPDGTDPAVGISTLRENCPAGYADADFELSGRSGPFSGWRRDVTTGVDGDARVTELAEGTYSLTLGELDWCAAEASSVDDGLIVIEPGQTTEVSAYLCGDSDSATPAGS